MNTQRIVDSQIISAQANLEYVGISASCAGTEIAALFQAQSRLKAAKKKKKRQTREAYYGDSYPGPEGILASMQGAIVTRNHYGCAVLNAERTLFIDVDMGEPAAADATGIPASNDSWQRTLDDLRTVLSNERDEGFRVYRTAAGFRLLVTTHEFESQSLAAARLMTAVGADDDFVKLCRIQNNFRARLTPKPWRCGIRQPPNAFPRHTAEDQSQFNHWLTQYDRACRGHATCRFLEHIGPTVTHSDIAPIVQLHDRETKAFQDLALA